MIEMRWLIPVSGEKKLQYRQKVDVNFYAGMPNMITWPQGPAPNMQWSEWRDVPLESERDPSYP